MIFLGDLTEVNETKFKIGLVHNKPFHEQHGFKVQDSDALGNLLVNDDGTPVMRIMTSEELLEKGVLVEFAPTPQPPTGQIVEGFFVNPVTSEVWYEYKERPKTQEEILQETKVQAATAATQATQTLTTLLQLQTKLGELPPIANPETLEDYKANKVYEIAKACETEILSGFYSTCRGISEWFTNSRDDQNNIIGQATLCTINPVITPQWKSASEAICTDFTRAQITQLATDGALFKTERIKTFESLKIAISECVAIEDVEVIVWENKNWL